MFFDDLRKKLEELAADVNPWDNGATSATVRANRNRPAPARTLRVKTASQPGSLRMGQVQQRQPLNIAPPQPTPSLRMRPQTTWRRPQSNFDINNPINVGQEVVHAAGEVGKNIAQGVARIPETVARSVFLEPLAGNATRRPENAVSTASDPNKGFREFLYGRDPVKSYQETARDVQTWAQKQKNPYIRGAAPAAPFIAPAMAAADLLVGTGVTKVAKPGLETAGKAYVNAAEKYAARPLPEMSPRLASQAGFAKVPTAAPKPKVPTTPAVPATTKSVTPRAEVLPPAVTKSQLPEKTLSSTNTKLNTSRLGLIDQKAKNRLTKQTTEIVNKLSNEDVKKIAQGAGIDLRSHGIEGTKKQIAKQLNVRNEIVTVESQITEARKLGDKRQVEALMKKSAELGRVSRSQGTDIARQLQARRIVADTLATPQQKLFRLLDEAGVNPDVYIPRLADVDMNSIDDVVKAYRELVPANAIDWLDKYRYTNMLSSPLTHVVNITSNLTGLSGVAPVQKLYEGAIDAVRAGVTGGARTRYAGEAGSYLKGAAKSLPEAVQRFSDIMRGKRVIEMPDADAIQHGRLAVGGVKGAADQILSFIPKLLEAADQLTMTMARAGEGAALKNRMGKGVPLVGDVEGMVDDAAKYRVFRQELGKEGQGALLEAIDFIPKALLEARRSKNKVISTIAKFTTPFVTTPTNLFKQGVEYSPVGLLTVPGHLDKTGQLAKAAMGTTVVALAAGVLASQDAITFNEPSSARERDKFRAEGKQPYAIKVGDKWISYSKLHPAISFNLALVAAVKQAQDDGDVDESTGDKILSIGGGILGYFRDQSFMKSVGDFTNAVQLKDGANMGDALGTFGSNYANQLVPFKSMVSWIGRQIDPTQRKIDYDKSVPEQIYQSMVKDIPGLNKDVPTRNNPYTGEPIKSDFPLFNAWSPLRVTEDKTAHNPELRAQMSAAEKMGDILKAKDDRGEKFKESFNDIDYKLLNLSKSDRQKLVDSGAVSQDKLDGLDAYAKNKRKELGYSQPEGKKTYAQKYTDAEKNFTENSKNWSLVERTEKKKELSRLKVQKDYDNDTIDLYSMSKGDVYDLVSKNKDGKAMVNKIVKYGDALVKAGVIDRNKYRNKYGKLVLNPSGTRSGGGGRRRKGSKLDYKLFASTSGASNSKQLYDMLKKAKLTKRRKKFKSPTPKIA